MNRELAKAQTVLALREKVKEYLETGWDLHGGFVTASRDLVGQWMVETPALTEYKLVTAYTLWDYEEQCCTLMDDGWHFWQSSARWGGQILQWMERPRMLTESAVTYTTAHMVIKTEPVITFQTGGARPFFLFGSMLEG